MITKDNQMATETKMQKEDSQFVYHPFEPVCDASSRVLILGTMPSVQSRQNQFYYGHPQNRFWPLLALLFNEPVPLTIGGKTNLLLKHHLALWDVLQQCQIRGSADSSIRDAVVNPIGQLLARCPIDAIFANGRTAGDLYRRRIEPVTHLPVTILPSTSPANARFSLDDLALRWQVILSRNAVLPE